MTSAELPHDIDAEKAVLGAILIRQKVTDVLGIVAIDDFILPQHRDIFEVLLDLSAQRSPLDILTVASELGRRKVIGRLDGGEQYLLELNQATNGRHYAEIVHQRATSRRLIAVCADSANRAHTESADAVMADLRVRLVGLRGESGGPVSMAEAMPKYLDELEAKSEKKEVYRVASGIRALDVKLRGGAPMGNLVVIGGNPGMGKTSLAFQWALHAASQGVPTLVLSLEMKRAELIDRGLSYFSRIDGARLSTADDLTYDDWKLVHQHGSDMAKLPLTIDDRKLTCDQIVAETIRWREKHKTRLALVMVDYLQLIRSTGRAENRQQEVGGWSREMKQVAGDADVALVLVSQLNRKNSESGEPQRPMMSHLRDSGEIEQSADTILFPWRSDDATEIGIAKNRGASVGVVPAVWDGPTTSFRDDFGDDFREDTRLPTDR
jgi:replicative DNA helicase